MKYLSGYIILLSSTLFGSGCSDNSGSASTTAYPLRVSSVSLSGVQTRSTTALATDGATISVSTLSSGAVSATSQYTYSSGAWGASSGSSGLVAPDGTALCAYYPYSAGITDKTAIPLSSVTYDASKDLCYGYATSVADAAHGTSRATFALQHAYARLTFSFSSAGSYTGSKSVGDIIISNPGILKSAALNITRSAGVYGSKVSGDVTFNAGITDFTATPSTSVLMVPTDALSGDLGILIQIGSDYKLLTLPATLFANSKLEAGVNYQIAVNVNGTLSLNSTDVQTTDWTAAASVTNPLNDTGITNIQPESNSYIVAPGGTIYVPVSRATTGNSANFPSGASFTTGLLWSDVSATHVTATAIGRYIKVVTTATQGNSVVYAKNSNGDIVWSWHIWVTNYNPGLTANNGTNTTTYSYNSNLWMDRNLGATTTTTATVTTLGLLYQWGRKDPFPGSSSVSAGSEPTLFGDKTSVTKSAVAASPNLVNSIQNPLTFYKNGNSPKDWYSTSSTTQNDALWYNGTSTKTIYDPCPAGWRVPFFVGGTSSWNGLGTSGTWNSGYTWSNVGYYPASGYRSYDVGILGSLGNNGNYWSASPESTHAYCMNFLGDASSRSVTPLSADYRANGFSVRCVKN